MGAGRSAELRSLPPVHELAAALEAPHPLAVAAARRAIAERRSLLAGGEAPRAGDDLLTRARAHLERLRGPSLRRVINATGVILHTNLGRAPLPAVARHAVAAVAEGYSNLELELADGARGSRHGHVEELLCELTGAQAAIAVNNGAGAVLLATAALAGPGRAVIVSRGQLVEIGGGFRVPDVIAQSGATMLEVGTTNRTHLRDYERGLREASSPVGAILHVHQSNFRTLGFVAEVAIGALCDLGPPVIDDLGSGVLAHGEGQLAWLGQEPDCRASLREGAALVCCSGDKLLGGPQAGLLLGTAQAVACARSHPLARALRIDKLSLAALEATLRLYRDPELARREVPVLAMLCASEPALERRAARLLDGIGAPAAPIRAVGRVGGGALPLAELEGPAVALPAPDPEALAARLRAADPPVVARIRDGQVVLDPRTVTDEEVELVVALARAALRTR